MITKTIVQALKPFQLASLTLTYFLGVGLVQYVRGMRSLPMIIEGFVFLLMVVISTELIVLSERLKERNQWLEGMQERDIRQIKWIILFINAAFLTVATTLVVGWMMRGILWRGLSFLLIVVVVACIGCFLTQVVESARSLKLFLETIIYLILPPALAFFLQSSDLHPFLTMTMVCLVPSYVACRLFIQIRQFGFDQKRGSQTIAVKIGWEKSMVFHNAFDFIDLFIFCPDRADWLPMVFDLARISDFTDWPCRNLVNGAHQTGEKTPLACDANCNCFGIFLPNLLTRFCILDTLKNGLHMLNERL